MKAQPRSDPADLVPPRPQGLLDAVTANLFDGFLLLDLEGVLRAANPAAEAMFGHGPGELIGREVALLFPPEANRRQDEAAGLHAWREPARDCALTGRRRDGALFPVLLNLIPTVVEGVEMRIAVVRDISERKQAQDAIRELVLSDSLTGLANRNLFRRRLEDAFRQADRRGHLVALLLLNLDGFKSINDNFGHSMGDALLKDIAERLRNATRKVDTVARLGGDEFGVIMVDLDTAQAARTVAERVMETLADPATLDGCLLKTGASMGMAFYPHDDTDLDELIRKADLALDEARLSGQGGYRLFKEVSNTQARAARVLETDLRLAIVRGEFLLHYQPKLAIDGRRVVGTEALLRWRHPGRGMIPPAEFIPIAEASDVMVPLGEWVLREACRQNKAWQDAGLPALPVAVNISARQLQDREFIPTLRKVLRETGLDPKWLELEITEGMVMDDTEQVICKFHRIFDLGVEISIDDFGTGYSSLAYLKRFPVQRLKIDQSFVRDLTTEPDDAAITEAVIKMGHSLKLKVIAEGVETEDQVAYLRSKGCDELQGFLFSRPLPAERFVEWYKDWSQPLRG
jgi:diguanylate cyclase (GGDEF)-like protein/PAS domain S-box-containing protein